MIQKRQAIVTWGIRPGTLEKLPVEFLYFFFRSIEQGRQISGAMLHAHDFNAILE